MINKEYINELLDSGITLTNKETQIVEEYLFNNSSYYYPPNYTLPREIVDDKHSKTLASGAVSKARRAS